jgi:biotin carboxyl carrier protein
VKSGQDVIVMEAMKMENQIQATVSGTVKKIYVKEGDTIQQDTPLIEIEA